MCLKGVPEEKRKNGAEEMFEVIKAKTFSK